MILGIDTSNYTTSAAVLDGEGLTQQKQLLEVRPGERGLRQSDALFHHTAALPEMLAELSGKADLTKVAAVGVATHRAKRLHRFKAFGQFRRPDVAGVPNFVAVLEIRLIAVVPIAVSVREQSDSFHGHLLSAVSFLMAKSLMSSAVASMPNTEELMQRW